ncbi:hypothetical protein [Mycobacterium sp. Marseille-P9652]|uniref:hypothetical protein n=1 Tax=Mycobacterium sp. Marseille-P9652 TaxID=2654950 RepID=UPI0012E8C18C|nr:hypothetical protein [Mycobacterium sp. Marseille-P9652]
MRRLVALCIPATAWLGLSVPAAQADIGGNVPGPGLCDYPGVGGSGMEMGAYHYWCDFPTEENGSRWHCEYGGGAVQGVGGVNILLFSASVITPLGVLEGTCSFRCPDGSLSAPPNPPGAWKNALTPKKCVPVEVAPASEPNHELPPWPGQLPGVTNPATPNPVTTENP